ncbi:Zinc finger, C2H2-like protein [Moelleriella libera RCEF 2490]|uniref:Zinc finger, C2H2-like protein n=1 Tax=Moelleriella libera RCEF 2490 TaxID=1081109 RepID=A0A168C253_9HYPO|nr:Zinc finger, C2H2-like protein [Moelleriella libera RCEF 2490]
MAPSLIEPPGLLQNPASRPRNPQPSASSRVASPYAFGLSPNQPDTTSPVTDRHGTPFGSSATLSQYQSSDFGDFDDDPFFGASFTNFDPATPSFLDESSYTNNRGLAESSKDVAGAPDYPLTPTHTASIHATSPRYDRKDIGMDTDTDAIPESISPYQLQKSPPKQQSLTVNPSALSPTHSNSYCSGEGVGAGAFSAMGPQSPRVTVSVWDRDGDAPIHAAERVLGNYTSDAHNDTRHAGDPIAAHLIDEQTTSACRGLSDDRRQPLGASRTGLDPRNRPAEEVRTINEIASQRETDLRNQEVDQWLSEKSSSTSLPTENPAEELRAIDSPRDDDDGIPLGGRTENRYVPGQTYFEGLGGQISNIDQEIIASNRVWGDAPVIPAIQAGRPGKYQPETSQDAIKRYENMCRDTDSVISRSATWGTRRRSLPSAVDVEGVISGNFLKKLTISRGSAEKQSRPSNFLRDLRGLVRRPSANQLRKRPRSRSRGQSVGQTDDERSQQGLGQPAEGESSPHLSPPLDYFGPGRRSTPSINTTLASVGQGLASMWTSHSRDGSITSISPTTSPRPSLGNLTVKTSLRRPRSKSDIPRTTAGAGGTESPSSLVEIWRKSGGPPVAPVIPLGQKRVADDDEDDDDDFCNESDLRADSHMIDQITPTLAGFQQHVKMLNPTLEHTHQYLVDRIAHQQVVRYKHLLQAKIKHLRLDGHCTCGSLCVALGGSANILDQKGAIRGPDQVPAGLDDDEGPSVEGAINQDSFPQGIPMPPTHFLPAEFECQLCFQRKKCQKPSDWTKHVHEDVQPFTCTWDNCKDHHKIFKRKADWVRHENEGHRHLEWWTCDVDDCRHVCYRRDNFLQHLVREHKFMEPKVKTKAAVKRTGDMDPTWRKVEQCHVETPDRPRDEPCRFCGKVFPTWKKLTVHLAKHMEQISLPILRLTDAKSKDLAADTIISPIRDPPSRQMMPPPPPTASSTPSSGSVRERRRQTSPARQQTRQDYGQRPGMGFDQSSQFLYPTGLPSGQISSQQHLYSRHFTEMGQNMPQPNSALSQPSMAVQRDQQGVRGMLSGQPNGFLSPAPQFLSMPETGLEAFPQLDINALGLQNMGDLQLSGQFGEQMGYEPPMAPCSVNSSPFSGSESLPTYPTVPNQTASRSNLQQSGSWNDQRPYL